MSLNKSSDIRDQFLKFFESKGHQIVASSSLVPSDDPTLLFTNAGMNQFKDVFLGFDKRSYNRATTSQKCVRAGGKHNDLENVGYTARHHTFFEMLGNFSFGDYFKHDALKYAWELLTEVYKLPKEKLWVTVYAEDEEAYNIWANDIGVPTERIIRIGDNKGARFASDNFWMMGDTGPCGPCSEIFYDHGPEIPGGPPGSPNEDGDRYIEIWNNVFMQFNRDEAGVMHPLPKPSVDTGMGLERITAVLQHVHSNYEIDLFQILIKAAAKVTGCSDLENPSLRVIADHIRACAFLVADGVIPSSDGRGYVLRRIIRRALRHGHKLGQTKPFFSALIPALQEAMGSAYPQLIDHGTRVAAVLLQEETRFGETLEHGMGILDTALGQLKPTSAGPQAAMLDGDTAFKLYDTFGFPLDLTADVCRERGVSVDEEGFNAAMQKQRDQARSAGKFKAGAQLEYAGQATSFRGYDELSTESKVLALYADGAQVTRLNVGQTGVVVLDQTPFYAESGGQVGDKGTLKATAGQFEVSDTLKIQADVFGHHGKVSSGSLSVGDVVASQVNISERLRTVRNHSATHLMHKALREVLGAHVQQKGSLVDGDKTRFDFSHHGPMTDEQISQIEKIVNDEILANAQAQSQVMSFDDAVKGGAMALFGEKYGDAVRVLDIGSSRELCGGTHVLRTGDIGAFKIVSQGGVAAGIRRVEALTGSNALAWFNEQSAILNRSASALKAAPGEITSKIEQLLEANRALEKELARLKSKVAAGQGDDLAANAIEISGLKVLAAMLDGADSKILRETMDKLKDKLKTAAIVLAAVQDGKVSLIAGVTTDSVKRIKAGELVNFVALQVGGKGGGRPDMAQAGGTNPEALPAALKGVADWVKQNIQ